MDVTWLQGLNIILFWVFAGLLCAWIAPKRGRDPRIWFFLGVLFSFFAIGLILLLPPSKKKKLKKKAELTPLPPSEVAIKVWFYLDKAHKQQGPVDFSAILKEWKDKSLTRDSYVWSEGMEKWEQIAKIPDVEKELTTSK